MAAPQTSSAANLPPPPHQRSELTALLAQHRESNRGHCQHQPKADVATPTVLPSAPELIAAALFVIGLSSVIWANPQGLLIQLKKMFSTPSALNNQHVKLLDNEDPASAVAAATLGMYGATSLILHLAMRGYCGAHNAARFIITCVYSAWNPAAPHAYSDHQLLAAGAILLLVVAAWDVTVVLNAVTGVRSLFQLAGTESCPFCGCSTVPQAQAKALMTSCADHAAATHIGGRVASWVRDDVDEDSRSWLSTYTFSWLSDIMRFAAVAPGYLADRAHIATVPRLPLSSRAATIRPVWARFVAWRADRKLHGLHDRESAFGLSLFFFRCTSQGRRFIHIIPLKIVQDVAATLVGPIAISNIIRYLRAAPSETAADAWEGVRLLTILLVALTAQAILFQAYLHHLYRVSLDSATTARTCLHDAVAECPAYARGSYAHGDIVAMATVDANRMSEAVVFLHNVWGHPLIIIVCLGALCYYVGLVPALAAFAALAGLAWVNRKALDIAAVQQKSAAAATGARTADTTDVLQCIRAIKFIGFERVAVHRLDEARDTEVRAENKSILSRAGTTLSAELGTALAYAACFIAFYLVDDDYDAARLVPAVSVLNSLRFPIWAFPGNAATIVRGAASASRIAAFLSDVADSCHHNRVERVMSASTGKEGTAGLEEALPPTEGTPFGSSRITLKRKQALRGAWIECTADAQVTPYPSAPFTLPLAVSPGGGAMRVEPADLVYICGGTGSGKTSLLRALAGEAAIAQGRVRIHDASKIALCPSTPWIFNGTVRENILGGLPLERSWYQKVLHATALADDVERWEKRDAHDVGNAGAALSGGQKARIALARACYANAELYLFDDVLSAVDEHVRRHIVQHCILGVLRSTTRIFVTTEDSGGALDAQLRNAANRAYRIVPGEGLAVLQNASMSIPMEGAGGNESPLRGATPASRASTPSLGSRPKPVPASLSNPATVRAANEMQRRFGWGWLVVVVLVACAAQGCLTALDASVGAWSSGRNTSGITLIRALCVLGLIGATMSATRALLFYRRSLSSSTELHKDVVHRVVHAGLSWLETPARIGGITAVLTKDQDVTDHAIPESVDALIASSLKLAAVCLFNAVIQPLLLLLVPPMVLSFSKVTQRYLDGARDMRRLEAVVKNDSVNCLQNALRGAAVARGLGMSEMLREEYIQSLDSVNAATNTGNLLARWVGLRLEAVAMLLAFFVACFAVGTRGSVNSAFAGVAVSNCLSVTRTMLMLCRRIGMFQSQLSSVEQLVGLHAAVPPSLASAHHELSVATVDPMRSPPLVSHGAAIEFVHVAVRYPGQSYDTVSDVCFRVGDGEHVTLVGRTGAGKSTLVAALLGHANVTSGAVYVLGETVADATALRVAGDGLPRRLRPLVGVVPQDPMLLPRMSWRQHLVNTLDETAAVPDEWLRAALATVGLDRICRDLDDAVELNGVHLSPAQAQVLSFARVLCMPSVRLVILDEVAASVDIVTERGMLAALKGLPSKPAILSIAHGGQALVECDRIIDISARNEDTPLLGSFPASDRGAVPLLGASAI